MGNAKVIFGNETLIDLTGDTVSANNLLAGETAHDRSGNPVVGNVTVPSALDDLTDVDITSAANNDLLQYNSTSGKWENNQAVPNNIAAIENVYGSKNLLQVTMATQTTYGVTYTVNADGSISLSNTSTSGGEVTIGSVTLPPGTYTMTGAPSGGGAGKWRLKFGASILDDGNGVTFTLNSTTTANVNFAIGTGNDFTGKVIYPMIRDARIVDGTYAPYAKTNAQLTNIDVWEDITGSCTFVNQANVFANRTLGILVNKVTKQISINVVWYLGTDYMSFNNGSTVIQLPNGYTFKTPTGVTARVGRPLLYQKFLDPNAETLENLCPLLHVSGRNVILNFDINSVLKTHAFNVNNITAILDTVG